MKRSSFSGYWKFPLTIGGEGLVLDENMSEFMHMCQINL